MKIAAPLIFLTIIIFNFTPTVKAQPKIIVSIDTAYAHTGKVELPLSQYGDELTDFYGVFPDINDISPVTICGKVGTVDPNLKKVGLIQLKPNGTFDSSFGSNGKTIINWNASDYPNSMFVVSDSSGSIFLAGASGKSSDNMMPAIFKFTKHGNPDSTFGGDGHIAIPYDSLSSGEFTMVTSVSTKFLAAGKVTTIYSTGHNGFCAMRFLSNGKIDSTYGIHGKALIPARMHSVFAFLTKDASITFIGVENKIDSEPPLTLPLILARLTPQGFPDSTFGINGILSTQKLVNENFGSLVAGIQPDYKIVAALPPIGVAGLMPVNLLRFTANGIIDSSFGTNGFTSVAFTNGWSKARGINIAKNAKTVLAGSAVGSLEQCATSRNNLDGTPDLTLNQIGTAVVDVDSGKYANYLIRFVGIGNKRYIGVGASIHNGLSQFLIARFKDDTLSTGGVSITQNNDLIQIYPNPVNSLLTITIGNPGNQGIKIIDALGREIKTFNDLESESILFDTSKLPDGIYYCIAEIGKQRLFKKFIVAH